MDTEQDWQRDKDVFVANDEPDPLAPDPLAAGPWPGSSPS